MPMTMRVMVDTKVVGTLTQVESGSSEITVTVTLSFEII